MIRFAFCISRRLVPCRLYSNAIARNSCLSLRKVVVTNAKLPSTHLIFRDYTMDHKIVHVNFQEVKEFTSDGSTLIIDVREPSELQASGEIPGSINIPLGDIKQALDMDDTSFTAIYKRQKPAKDSKIVFSCRSGKRSMQAADAAVKMGFTDVVNFDGGWMAWEENMNKEKAQ